ncbi:MAG: Rpn family recombination-promoting nuclease/putative transposase [Aureispira sp.]
MRFVDVKNDVAFRKIFGNEQKTSILISFLNAALNLERDKSIKKVSIINPYLLPRIAGEKASIIDVRAEDARGQHFIIEMQMADVDGFDKRVQYYTCRDYSAQLKQGEKYHLLKPTYFIGILDFNFFESKDYLSHHIIVNGKTYEHKLKDIQFTFIELRKFNKTMEELVTLVDKWIFFIKNAKNLDIVPDNTIDLGLIEAYKDAEKYSWNRDELIAYDNFFIAEQDAKGRITAATRKAEKIGEEKGKKIGEEIGKEIGKEIGISETKKAVIKQCLQKNIPLAMIAELVELSPEQTQELIENLNN